MSKKTPAQQQIEALKKLREMRAKKSAPVPSPKPKLKAPGLPVADEEPVEAPPERHLVVSEELWQRLKERQARTREFKKRQEAGDWAAELLLSLPPGIHQLDPSAKAALFALVDQWFTARSRS